MKRQITISNAHPTYHPAQSMTVDLEGGAPWYGYIWIDGELYTITLGRNYKIKKTTSQR